MSARVLDCPQCGAPVNFQSSIAVFAVCAHCQSMVVLRGEQAERIGVMAALPPDLTPFQIGTRGEWKGRGFEIVGRIRVEWDEGSWNEWCILYDAKTLGWLAEAQGLLMVSFAAEVKEKLPTETSAYTPKETLMLDGCSWTISDVKTTTYRASEGELPFPAPPNSTQVSIDLINSKGGFAGIELSKNEAEVFLGEFVEFENLRLTNLRPVPGWSAEIAQEKNATTALSCPSCGGVIELRAIGQSMSAVCTHCHAIIDTARPELKLIAHADVTIRQLAPLLPIGQRGKLFGTDYEVIGFVRRADQYSKWDEYLLFNPWQGFRWLVSFAGHWSFITRLPSMPEESGHSIVVSGRRYKLFADGIAEATGVLGEFYWQIRRGEKATVYDYVAPPFILSQEVYPDLVEVAWSQGEYVESRVIADAFALKNLPRPQGVYLNEPNRAGKRLREIALPLFLALAALVLIQFASVAQRREAELTQATFTFDRRQLGPHPIAKTSSPAVASTLPEEKLLTTPHFNLEGGEQRVVVQANAPVSNNWLDLDLDLVNAKTNASFPAAIELSAYHGYDSDGAWSEGSQTASAAFPAVPPGEYFLAIEPSAEANIQNIPYTVRVRAGGVFNSNFFIMLGLVMIYPAILIWRRYRFEQRRWEESDYTA